MYTMKEFKQAAQIILNSEGVFHLIRATMVDLVKVVVAFFQIRPKILALEYAFRDEWMAAALLFKKFVGGHA